MGDNPVTSEETNENLEVGIMEDPFTTLKELIQQNKLGPTNLCSLLIDELFLTQKYMKYKGKTFGYTEGMGKTPLNEPKKMASKAVVFTVVSLTEKWEIPVALFFVHNPDIKYFADTIEESLKKLNNIGIKIISITMTCLSPHLSFALAEELGSEIEYNNSAIKKLVPYFTHPTDDSVVYIIYDINATVGVVKTYWMKQKTILIDGQTVNYNLVNLVKKIEEKDLQSYGVNVLYDWIIIRKRLSYDTEHFSKNVAYAMEYLKDLGHPDFQDAAPTIQFIKVLDYLTKLFNESGEEFHMSCNLSSKDKFNWKLTALKILNYIRRQSYEDAALNISITGLAVSLTAILQLYGTYIETEHINSWSENILPYQMGLKNIAQIFKNWSSQNETALDVFKTCKTLTKSIHSIR